MTRATKVIPVICIFLLGGCATNDFKVVDALRIGESPEEVQAAIKSCSFKKTESFLRPIAGWPSDRKGSEETAWRAGRLEAQSGTKVSAVELYPIHHGLLGYGHLYVFYGEDGRLVNFYRRQIN